MSACDKRALVEIIYNDRILVFSFLFTSTLIFGLVFFIDFRVFVGWVYSLILESLLSLIVMQLLMRNVDRYIQLRITNVQLIPH